MAAKQLIEKLSGYGADISGAMERFLNDAELYETCFNSFLSDETFSQLQSALEAADYKTAFETAHNLKGVSGNLGLTPLYSASSALVAALRANEYDKLQALGAEVFAQLEQLKAI